MGITPPNVPVQAIVDDLPRLARNGLDTVTVDAWMDIDSERGSTIRPGSITTPDADLERIIGKARADGLKVILEPKLWCPSCPLTWRGILRPKDSRAFFASYRSMISRYAALARRTGVDLFFIGSEMSLVQDATDEWRSVARQAKADFGGRIAYEVNWDVWQQVRFWDAVDVVSVSAYFPLSDAERPRLADLKAGWETSGAAAFKGRNWADEMATLARTTGKPLLFGEAGYLSSTFAARKPYDQSERFRIDQQVQADAYQALLEVFETKPWFMGVVWWEWIPTAPDTRSTTYSPRGKLAEDLLTAWYGRGWRPGAPGAPLSAVTDSAAAGLGFSVAPELLNPTDRRTAPERSAVAADAASTLELRRQSGLRGDRHPPSPSGGAPAGGRLGRLLVRLWAAAALALAALGHRALVRRHQRGMRPGAGGPVPAAGVPAAGVPV